MVADLDTTLTSKINSELPKANLSSPQNTSSDKGTRVNTKSSGIRMNRPSRSTNKRGASGLALPSGSSASGDAIGTGSSTPHDPHKKLYLTRAVAFDQMDIQAALDQMRTLCSLTPQRVYKTSYYRKQTKNHWARDDPAFAVLEIVFLLVASFAYCVAFKQSSMLYATLRFALQHVVGFWLGFGVVMSTVGRFVANSYLTHGSVGGSGGQERGGLSSHHVRQGVEWLYAFDIHCNAFLPLFIVLYAIQFFLLPLVLGKSLVALIVSNTLYAGAFSWYFYVTHLGYRALPFLSGTEVFLFPIVLVICVYVLNFVGYPFGLGWNASRIMAHVYFD